MLMSATSSVAVTHWQQMTLTECDTGPACPCLFFGHNVEMLATSLTDDEIELSEYGKRERRRSRNRLRSSLVIARTSTPALPKLSYAL